MVSSTVSSTLSVVRAPAESVPARSRRVLTAAVRFLLVGGFATVVDIGLFNLLHYGLGVGPLSSKVGSTVVAALIAFVGNRQWSFAGTAGRVHHQALGFLLVNAAALALALLPLAVARYVLGLTSPLDLNIAGNVIGLAMATCLRFYGYHRWVFPPARRQAEHTPATCAAEPTCEQCERLAA